MVGRLRGAIIGYGFIAEGGHARAYRGGAAEIVAVADVCAARRAKAAADLPGARLYESPEQLLEAEAARLDFADICAPPRDHARVAHAALARGLHVLCEKPLAVSPREARALLAHAREARRVLYPCHNYKHAPVIREVAAVLAGGRIGAVRGVTLGVYRLGHALGAPEWNPHWRRCKDIGGGGIAFDHGSHAFYLLFDWMGGYPAAVSARMTLEGRAPTPMETEDTVCAALSYPRGMAQLQLTWRGGSRKVVYAIQGERGSLLVNDDELEIGVPGQPVERRRISSHWGDASHVGWFQPLFDGFERAIGEGDYAGREARDAAQCIEVIAAAYESARLGGREVRLPAAPERTRAEAPGRAAGQPPARVTAEARAARIARDGGSWILGRAALAAGHRLLEPLGEGLARLGVRPHWISWASLVLGAAAGGCLGAGRFGWGAGLAAGAAAADGLDGMVARATRTDSDAGEVLDAAVDRYVEFFLLGGLLVYYRGQLAWQLVTLAALGGSFMVSYSTAKGEALGVTPPRGVMRRAERAFYLILGAAAAPLSLAFVEAPTGSRVALPVAAAVTWIAVLSNGSAIARLRAVARLTV